VFGTWTLLTPLATTTAGELSTVTYQTSPAVGSQNYRIRLRFALWSATQFTKTVEMNALTLHFAFMETDRHQWQLTIPAVLNVQRPDDITETSLADSVYEGTPSEIRNSLWNWLDSSFTLTLKDRDGTDRVVHLVDLVESEPVPNDAPNREMFFSMMLMEL